MPYQKTAFVWQRSLSLRPGAYRGCCCWPYIHDGGMMVDILYTFLQIVAWGLGLAVSVWAVGTAINRVLR